VGRGGKRRRKQIHRKKDRTNHTCVTRSVDRSRDNKKQIGSFCSIHSRSKRPFVLILFWEIFFVCIYFVCLKCSLFSSVTNEFARLFHWIGALDRLLFSRFLFFLFFAPNFFILFFHRIVRKIMKHSTNTKERENKIEGNAERISRNN